MIIFLTLMGVAMFFCLCLALYFNHQGTKPLPDDSEQWRRSYEAYGPKSKK